MELGVISMWFQFWWDDHNKMEIEESREEKTREERKRKITWRRKRSREERVCVLSYFEWCTHHFITLMLISSLSLTLTHSYYLN